MKRLSTILASVFICLFALSCSDNETIYQQEDYERDNSLAGSISFVGYKMEAEAIYDGIALENFRGDFSYIDIRKVSEDKVSLFCYSEWGNTVLTINIPYISINGEPYDVEFDCSSKNAIVSYDDIQYTSVMTYINGWITEVQAVQSDISESDGDPATPDYNCEINIECNLSGKVLNLKIYSVNPF